MRSYFLWKDGLLFFICLFMSIREFIIGGPAFIAWAWLVCSLVNGIVWYFIITKTPNPLSGDKCVATTTELENDRR
jgi:hypothetical protein